MGETTLFNLKDIAVLFSGFLALAMAIMLIFRQQTGRIKRCYWICLSVFFFLRALHEFDTLVYWSIDINAYLSSVSTNFFFLFGFIFFLQGPLLYAFTKAAIYRDFSLKRKYLLHLIPALVYPFYIYAIYHRHDDDYKLQFIRDWSQVVANPYFDGLLWAQWISMFIYSVLCARMLYHYVSHLKCTHSSLSKVDLQWLKLLLIGFLIINAWVILTLLESRFTNWGVDSEMGQIDSLLRFIYMAVLVIYLLQNSKGLAEIQVEHTIAPNPSQEEPQHQFLDKLQAYMETEKPYLEPNISVERLAIRLHVSPKLLSSTINNHLHKNFFEMIGHYRLEEAKKQLADPALRDLPIGEVMKKCGFNSKSVFNQAFKKSVGVTPSHYRQQHIS